MKTPVKLNKKEVPGVIRVDEAELKQHLSGIVRVSVEETLNALLDAEADALCQARRYERSTDRLDTMAGHYGACSPLQVKLR